MAERRMFAKSIVDSDAFLDMPLSTQALYFHLSMRADDEGFINNPRRIQRTIGASDDDIKLLIAKNFVIPFESGVVVIKHWRIHNYIRGDRLIATNYQTERAMLDLQDNGAYEMLNDPVISEQLSAEDKRAIAYKNSSLPYSFVYKIKRAFYGHSCPICGCTMDSSCKQTLPTVQHNKPISKGGLHELDNIAVICTSCNTSIRDNETEALNNAEVAETWNKILFAERNKIDWFSNPEVLDTINVGQLTDKCQTSDRQETAQDRLGKDRLDKDIYIESPKPTPTPTKRWTKPTLDEVKAYVAERGGKIDAEKFYDFYESKDWMVGKNKMKDFKAAIRNWERSQTRTEDIVGQLKKMYAPEEYHEEVEKNIAVSKKRGLRGGAE